MISQRKNQYERIITEWKIITNAEEKKTLFQYSEFGYKMVFVYSSELKSVSMSPREKEEKTKFLTIFYGIQICLILVLGIRIFITDI